MEEAPDLPGVGRLFHRTDTTTIIESDSELESYENPDFMFIKKFLEEHRGRVRWTILFAEGRSKDLFKRYSNAHSLKSSYNKYRQQSGI
ncbi:uncharacterized protein BYT42DRAFT_572661 [Radiomyces spectabilis]|uniref:uncharacterized protein n=1 Tax=Radiomyces spectabilis TaxID=64574 RepID=UPI002220AFA4|nr:uncharacterized protein BYT42DRAFT_572661 [Radiomyces spectabilis]KAI8378076.1 hypothetical protein BYT42DRAFT_572661 [Radiomyces spectabilis]